MQQEKLMPGLLVEFFCVYFLSLSLTATWQVMEMPVYPLRLLPKVSRASFQVFSSVGCNIHASFGYCSSLSFSVPWCPLQRCSCRLAVSPISANIANQRYCNLRFVSWKYKQSTIFFKPWCIDSIFSFLFFIF